MLPRTFVHLPGVGYATERRFWERGLHTWAEATSDPERLPVSPGRRAALTERLTETQARFAARDSAWFAAALRPRDHWRALGEFGERIGYLDIETDGDNHDDCVTVIGLYDGETVEQFVRGENLAEFPAAVAAFPMLATFFGSGFDLPVLRRQFAGLEFPQLHVDLCWALRKLGYQGGLKSIEQQLGWERSSETVGLGGMDAVRLWSAHQRGSAEALDLLKRYNAEDIISLKPLAEFARAGLTERLLETGA